MKKKLKQDQLPDPDGNMSLSGHLKELRNRLVVCVLLLLAAFAACLSVAPAIVTALTDMGEQYAYRYVYIAPQELLLVYMNVALIGALVVCFPVLAYQAYAFCRPGLGRRGRIYTVGALIAGAFFFLAGAAFAYYISMPFMLRFLIQFTHEVNVAASISINEYVSFLLTVFVIFGLVFELPVASVLLTGLGVIKAEWLVKGRRIMIVLIFVLAAIITPPDVVSQIMVAVPMLGLYELSIVLSRLVGRMKKKTAAQTLVLLLAVLLLSGCGAPAQEAQSRTVFAMDTVMNLTAYGKHADEALAAAVREVYRLDALLARGVEGSAVYAYNHGGTENDELRELLAVADAINASTDGAFDPYLGGVLDLWGFGSGAGEHHVPTDAEFAAAERLLDLGGIAKGYAGQRVCEALRENHVSSAVVDLGGDVALLGKKPDGSSWRIAIKDPGDTSAYLGVLQSPGDRYVATSGVYERFFEENGIRYHHILDPRTGFPADSALVSATVICENGVWADALATAVCVLGAEQSLQMRQSLDETMPFDLIVVTEDGHALYTCDDFTPAEGNDYVYEKVS